MDQPSETMWCTVRRSRCSRSPVRTSAARSRGPQRRSKVFLYSSVRVRSAWASRRAAGVSETGKVYADHELLDRGMTVFDGLYAALKKP